MTNWKLTHTKREAQAHIKQYKNLNTNNTYPHRGFFVDPTISPPLLLTVLEDVLLEGHHASQPNGYIITCIRSEAKKIVYNTNTPTTDKHTAYMRVWRYIDNQNILRAITTNHYDKASYSIGSKEVRALYKKHITDLVEEVHYYPCLILPMYINVFTPRSKQTIINYAVLTIEDAKKLVYNKKNTTEIKKMFHPVDYHPPPSMTTTQRSKLLYLLEFLKKPLSEMTSRALGYKISDANFNALSGREIDEIIDYWT